MSLLYPSPHATPVVQWTSVSLCAWYFKQQASIVTEVRCVRIALSISQLVLNKKTTRSLKLEVHWPLLFRTCFFFFLPPFPAIEPLCVFEMSLEEMQQMVDRFTSIQMEWKHTGWFFDNPSNLLCSKNLSEPCFFRPGSPDLSCNFPLAGYYRDLRAPLHQSHFHWQPKWHDNSWHSGSIKRLLPLCLCPFPNTNVSG